MGKISIARQSMEKQKFTFSVSHTITTNSIYFPPKPKALNITPHSLVSLISEDASQRLRVSKNTIYRQLRSGNLSGHKIGRQWRIPLKSITLRENYKRKDR